MMEAIRKEWNVCMEGLLSGPFFRAMQKGELGLIHYKAWLRETYYNVRENPSSFALMAGHLKGNKRDASKLIFRHCAAEYGHHEMALQDLKNLGADVSGLPGGRALPTTEAMIATAVYNVQHASPLYFLGYLYHLETLPALMGGNILASLAKMGVPQNAVSFVAEHAELDVAHTKLMDDYCRMTVESDSDLEAIIHGARSTCILHGIMLQGILDSCHG